MDAGSQALLKRAVRAFDLADMRVGWNDVELDWADIVANAIEFTIGVNVADVETSVLVGGEHALGLPDDGLVRSIRDGGNGAVTKVSRDRMEKRKTLHKQKINAQRDVTVELDDGRWEWHGGESRDPRRRG